MTEGETLSKQRLLQILQQIAAGMKGKSDQLRILDAACGDGDLGVTITKGFAAVEEKLLELEGFSLDEIFKTVGMTFNNAAASTFGVFFATACKSAGEVLVGKESIAVLDLCTMLQAAAQGISKRGKAKVGDKTILDALVPATEAACQAVERGASFHEVLEQAAAAAKIGAERTKGMLPQIGRARWLGEKTKDVQDPGATFVHLFLMECLTSAESLGIA
ncbi:MAG: dihydroxyacetone kinase subunit L [Candidatus Latescibacteria bacterium]|nr:dihydroxyacetone kinase subunit L [Candidatus Latescibacterota bacterium]